MRTLVETGVLVGERGAYRLGRPLEELQVPATVQAVLAARIDRLPPEEKRLLQTAAVIGTEVPLPLLQAIAELPEEALHRGLAHLQAAEFLYETRLFPEPEYTFKHALTHEVAYGSLLLERRRGLHARLVEALEALDARAGGRAGRPPGAPCPAGRGVGQGRDLLPAGRCQGLRPRRVPRGGGLLRAGPPGPRAPARGRRYQGAGHRSPPRVGSLADRTGRVWAEPRPVGRGRGPGQGARRSGPAGMGAGRDGYGTQDRRETPTAPWRRASRPSHSRPRSVRAPCRWKHPFTWGRHTYAIGDFGRAADAAAAECGGGGQGGWHAQYRHADPVPGVAGADLERAWGLRRGPAPRGGGAPPRHAGRPRGHTDHCPRLPRRAVPHPRGPGARHPGCSTRAWPSVVPPAAGVALCE